MTIRVVCCIVVVVIELIVSQLEMCLFQNLDFIKKKTQIFVSYRATLQWSRVLRRLLDNAPSTEFREGSGTGYTGAKGTTMS